MGIAQALQGAVSKAIKPLGGDVTIRFVTAGAYDPAAGTVSQTFSDEEVKGVLTDVVARKENELNQTKDKKLTVAAADLTAAPETKDLAVVDSVVYQIIAVETYPQGTTAISYELTLRA